VEYWKYGIPKNCDKFRERAATCTCTCAIRSLGGIERYIEKIYGGERGNTAGGQSRDDHAIKTTREQNTDAAAS
jgi:hypothetical protein